MIVRKGEVTNIDTSKGQCKVYWQDQGNTSVWLPVIGAVDMPKVGDKVITLQMENGSVKGFVLGYIYNEDDHWVLPTRYEFLERLEALEGSLEALEGRVTALEG